MSNNTVHAITPVVAVLALVAACAGIWPTSASAAEPSRAPIVFMDITEKSGLLAPVAGIMGHGGAWGDVDGDGRADLFVGGFCDRPNAKYQPAAGPVPSQLFRNLPSGRFERIDQPALTIFARTSGAVFADLDNNGTLDLYVSNNAKSSSTRRSAEERGALQSAAQGRHCQLFRNDGGTLFDVSAACGACPETLHTARSVAVLDFDGDGLLDLFVVEDRFNHNPRSTLFRNKGDLKFEDANKQLRLPDDIFGLGMAVADLNGDGLPDFFVAHSNRMFLSQPDGGYREATELRSLFAWEPRGGEDWPCGAAFGDLNRDGRLDLVVSIHAYLARNRVYLNEGLKDGIPWFRDVTQEAGLADIVPVHCPHVEIQDFDNDGWPDIFISAAWLDGDRVTPLVFRNQGVREGLPRFLAPRTIKEPMMEFPAAPSADFDQDGRIDLFLVNFVGDRCRLLHNESPPRHWLQLRVVGRRMNRMGIGAQVRVYQSGKLGQPGGLLGFQEVAVGYGYSSGQTAMCHFGLGDERTVDVRVTLPTGVSIDRAGVEADRAVTIEEPK